jgi:hypothetical protein
MGRDNLESLNGGVEVAQNTIRNQRGLILRRTNLGMLDDRELVSEISHASAKHGNSTWLLDGRQGIQFCFHSGAKFSTGVVEIGRITPGTFPRMGKDYQFLHFALYKVLLWE